MSGEQQSPLPLKSVLMKTTIKEESSPIQKVVQVGDQEVHTEGGYNAGDMKGGE